MPFEILTEHIIPKLNLRELLILTENTLFEKEIHDNVIKTLHETSLQDLVNVTKQLHLKTLTIKKYIIPIFKEFHTNNSFLINHLTNILQSPPNKLHLVVLRLGFRKRKVDVLIPDTEEAVRYTDLIEALDYESFINFGILGKMLLSQNSSQNLSHNLSKKFSQNSSQKLTQTSNLQELVLRHFNVNSGQHLKIQNTSSKYKFPNQWHYNVLESEQSAHNVFPSPESAENLLNKILDSPASSISDTSEFRRTILAYTSRLSETVQSLPFLTKISVFGFESCTMQKKFWYGGNDLFVENAIISGTYLKSILTGKPEIREVLLAVGDYDESKEYFVSNLVDQNALPEMKKGLRGTKLEVLRLFGFKLGKFGRVKMFEELTSLKVLETSDGVFEK